MHKQFYIWSLLLFVSLGFVACGSESSSPPDNDRPLKIVTTTGMIRDMVENIVGDKAEVDALMGPGVDPHLYKATQGDLRKLNSADLIVYNGLHLEGKMGEIFGKMGERKPVVAVAEGIPEDQYRKAAEFGDAHDPHIWFDVRLWSEAAPFLADTLGRLNPANADVFKENARRYKSELDSLHQWVQTQVNTLPQEMRVLITAHDAFGYFGRAYGMEVKGLQGISTVSEFGLKDVTNLVEFIVERGIKAVFIETSVSGKSINAVVEGCKEKGHEIRVGGSLFSDAMGAGGTPEGTYVGMVRANVNTLVEGLK